MEIKDRNHETFKNLCKNSRVGVYIVAGWLLSLNIYDKIHVPKMSIAPTRQVRDSFKDIGDIIVTADHKEMRVEVKHLSRSFTSAGDWPFGKKYIVCSEADYTEASSKPYCYIALSSDGTHIGIVKVDYTKGFWTVEERKVSTYESITKPFYIIDTKHVNFMEI